MKNASRILAFAVAMFFGASAFADSYTSGAIGVNLGNDSWSSTGVTFSTTVGYVADTSGTFSTLYHTFPSTPTTTSVSGNLVFATPGAWTLTVGSGATEMTFVIKTLTITENTPVNLQGNGTGTITIAGYLPTNAVFNFDSTDSTGNSGGGPLSASTFGIDIASAPTPEPTSLIFFGTGLIGVAGAIRRKLAK